jgi:sec-independent protein translocase protein TatA
MFTGLENPFHLLLLLLLLLVLFGARRLPEMGRSLGTGMREFRDSLTRKTPASDSPPALDAPSGDDAGKRTA